LIRVRPLLGLAVAALALSAATAPGAAAFDHRTPHSPCHGHGKSIVDEGSNGVLHCSAVWEIPPHQFNSTRSYEFPETHRPPNCANGTTIKGTSGNPDFWTPHWFFTPAHGQWVTWQPQEAKTMATKHGHDAINLSPSFYNWATHDWPTRYYFYCNPPARSRYTITGVGQVLR
jgi:hypothetical protein